jgi:peptide/nickel transport system ATP-binding protein
MPLVEIRDLTKIFPGATTPSVAGVSLQIEPGETLGLVGESGSGKTTLGRMVLGLIEPTSGTVLFDGQDVLRARGTQLRQLRRNMQIIFQDPFGALNPRWKIFDIVTEPLIIHERPSRQTLRLRAAEMMRAVGLDESALPRFPHEFSGGQRQRIVIARALALRPRFIVADEPVSALDVSVGAQIVNLLKRLQAEFGLTYLFISHSMPVVRYLATRIAVMHRGKVVEVGPAEQVVRCPEQEYTRNLVAATPEMPTRA